MRVGCGGGRVRVGCGEGEDGLWGVRVGRVRVGCGG